MIAIRDNNVMLLVAAICISDIFEPTVFDYNIPIWQQKLRINLTVIGIIEGLICGIGLHMIVIYMAEVDIVMFGRGLSAKSFIYAALLAFVFSTFVSIVLHRKLRKVDMVESLKSIE